MLGERPMAAGEISAAFPISGPSMSHHFNVLKAADLIDGRRDGQQIVYTLNTTVVQDLMAFFLDVFAKENMNEPIGEDK